MHGLERVSSVLVGPDVVFFIRGDAELASLSKVGIFILLFVRIIVELWGWREFGERGESSFSRDVEVTLVKGRGFFFGLKDRLREVFGLVVGGGRVGGGGEG